MNNILKTILYLSGLTLLLLALGQFLGGSQGMFVAFVFAVLINFLAFGWSDKIVLWIYRAEPLSEDAAPEVFAILRELCEPVNFPKPHVYLIPSLSPNAFATGSSPRRAAIVLTQGAIETLNREELKGVLAHELAHVENRDTLLATFASALAGFLSLLASGVKWMFWVGSPRDSKGESKNPIVFLARALFLSLAALLIRLAIFRSREYEADRRGAEWCGDPLYLASALFKLEAGLKQFPMRQAEPSAAHLFVISPLQGKLAVLFKTHPPLEERIARLEEMARRIGKG